MIIGTLNPRTCAAVESSLSVQYRVSESQRVLEEFVGYLHRVSLDEIASASKVLILIPNAIEESYVFKGQHGEGVMLYRSDNGSWNGPAFISLFGKSSDWNSADTTADLVMVLPSAAGMDPLLQHRFILGSDIRSVAGYPAKSDVFSSDPPIRTFLRQDDIFIGVDLNGSVIQEDLEANKAYYTQALTSHDILTGKHLSPGPDSGGFGGIITRMNGFPEFEQTMQRVE